MSWQHLPGNMRVRLLLALLVLTFAVISWGMPGGEAIAALEPTADLEAPEIDADGPSQGEGKGWILALAVVVMIAMGSPLFMIIGVLACLAFAIYSEGYDDWSVCSTLDTSTICGYDSFPAKMGGLTTKNVLLAIPFFVVSGAIMSAGDIANRLVAFARALVGFLPGGLAVASVGGCVFFAAISGSSPVTVIAIGSVMYPALIKAGYDEKFSLGLVTSAGSLGIVIPPSIPMLVYAIVAGGSSPIDVGELFMSGILPGMMLGGLLAMYSVVHAMKHRTADRVPFSWGEVQRTLKEGLWAILLPVQILGGIYSGLFTPTEAAAVSVVYALAVELFIHRQLAFHQLPKILVESAVMMGSLIVIMALAFGLNDFLVEEKIPDAAIALIQSWDLDALEFLLVVNAVLLVAGALMDSISAIMILAPLVAPIAIKLGIDPIHLGIIFIVNLEIGYLTPPIGLNLFVAASVFDKPLGVIMKAVVPYIVVLLAGLMAVTYVPSIAMGPVNVILREKGFYEPLPGSKPAVEGPQIARPGETGADGKRVMSMQEMAGTESVEIAEGALIACEVAQDVYDAEPPKPLDEWLARMQKRGLHARIVDPAKAAVAAAGTPAAFEGFAAEMKTLTKQKFDCEELAEMLQKKPGAE
jgi:C4-dicarboxylate transporter DctM subunit